ncbi:DUF3618 domain-containing protein [Streptomyces cellostaticus]|uniref:DUF3618 domain-containing protein n=1 Tax=Streptomyces cellostaticus TaxID=67285 RepID=UPI0020269376|nr:DUF3618 domain-containing protein [Streptomyces cellostaticus]
MSHKNPHGSGAKGPDELRHQIERTRSQLGDTVEQLVGRADMKGRAKARAADLKDKAGAMSVQLRSSAAQAGHTVQGRSGHARHALQDRSAPARHALQERAATAGHALQEQATSAGHALRERRTRHAGDGLPELRGALEAGRRHRGPVLAAGALTAAAVVAVVAWRRQRGRCS